MNTTYILIWIVVGGGLGALIGNAARKRGRSFWPWVFLSLLTTPLIAWVIYVATNTIQPKQNKE